MLFEKCNKFLDEISASLLIFQVPAIHANASCPFRYYTRILNYHYEDFSIVRQHYLHINLSAVIFIYEEIFSINTVHSCHITSAKIQSVIFQRLCFADKNVITTFLHWNVSHTWIQYKLPRRYVAKKKNGGRKLIQLRGHKLR